MRGDFQGLSPSFLFSHLFFLPAHTPFPSTYTEKLGRPLRRIHVEGFSCRTRHAFTTYGGDTTPVTAGYINKSPDFNSPDVLNIVEKTAHFLSSTLGVKNIQLWVFFPQSSRVSGISYKTGYHMLYTFNGRQRDLLLSYQLFWL